MWVIVKHVIVIEDGEPVNMIAIQVDEGCHNKMNCASLNAFHLNERFNTDAYDSVFILNHS